MVRNMKKQFKWIKITGLVIIPIILMIMPSNYFDQGQSICLSKVLLDQECYGCGMTRAVMHLIHFEFIDAYHFNKISFIVFPMMGFLWMKELVKEIRQVGKYQVSTDC